MGFILNNEYWKGCNLTFDLEKRQILRSGIRYLNRKNWDSGVTYMGLDHVLVLVFPTEQYHVSCCVTPDFLPLELKMA